MKKLVLLAITIFTLTACNKRTALTGEQFKQLAEQHGFRVEQIVGDKDAQIGIIAKYNVYDTAGIDTEMEIMFFELVGNEQAKGAFNVFRSEMHGSLSSPLEHGLPNDSGAFGNTQEYFAFTTRGESTSLIRVGNTLAYSYTATSDSRKAAEKLFIAMGYMDKKKQ